MFDKFINFYMTELTLETIIYIFWWLFLIFLYIVINENENIKKITNKLDSKFLLIIKVNTILILILGIILFYYLFETLAII